MQCDQIGWFNALYTTFQSLCQQLFCPNCLHYYTIFVKSSKTLIFLLKSFLGNFYRHLMIFYWSHWMDGRLKWFIEKERLLRSFSIEYFIKIALAENIDLRKWRRMLHLPFVRSFVRTSVTTCVTRLSYFWKVLVTNIPSLIAQLSWNILGLLRCVSIWI